MITDKFWDLAAKSKDKWQEGGHPAVDWVWDGTNNFEIIGTATHCGTSELSFLESRRATLEVVACCIARTVYRNQEGNFLYYCPKIKQYTNAVKKFQKLGAEKLYTFYHANYLDREPDKGVTDLWVLSFTPDELARLKAM